MNPPMRSWSRTDLGTKRPYNEDAMLDRPEAGLWVVADGAGGHSSGDVASSMIVKALDGIPADLEAAEMLTEIRSRMDGVHQALLEEAARRGPDIAIASTVVILCIRGQHFVCLWVGDSRIYRFNRGVLQQVTHDHSVVQELVDSGQLSPEEAEGHPHANVITRAVGAPDTGDFQLDKVMGELTPGDRFLLCSDGLTKSVPEAELTRLLAEGDEGIAERLIEAALERQARDNVTAVVVAADEVDDTLGG
jgi:serine/threonine protein phosphatase Stp1